MKTELTNKIKKAGGILGNTATKVANSVKSTTSGITNSIKDKKLAAKQKKLNPLFPAEYRAADFHIPNLVVIVDDAVRRDEVLCEGAIGWRNFSQDVEILYLYDEFVPECGLTFVPEAVCDAAYYVDPHNRSRFIRIDYLFQWSQQEKLAELSNIAYCLGADCYSVSLVDKKTLETSTSENANVDAKKKGIFNGEASIDRKLRKVSGIQSKSLASVEFTETRDPVEPELCWFRNDRYIQELIKQRCEQHIKLNKIDIELSGSEYSTMSTSTSVKVDAAIAKIGLKVKADIKSSSKEEHSRVMLFHLEFKKRGLFSK